ncbi:hypothetical protein BDF22DRAFT_746145 [Syncephalis plumigaleata]|nr:hypothetical protein BDF22DRAFT_746145 [Syncephalis plumigaleata]
MYLQVAIDYRVWNRDMAACLNFIQIIHSVRKDKEVEMDKDNKPIKKFEHRLWNRDMAACLNFIQIILSARNGSRIPTQFQRGAVPSKRSRQGGQGQRGSKQQKSN